MPSEARLTIFEQEVFMPAGVKTEVSTYQMYINGDWVDSRSNKTFPVYDPANEEVLAQVPDRSEEHTSELQSPCNLVCRLLLEKKKKIQHGATVSSPHVMRRAVIASTV